MHTRTSKPSFFFDSFPTRQRRSIRVAQPHLADHPYLLTHLENLSCQVSKEADSYLIVPLEDFWEALRLLQTRAIPYSVQGERQLVS